MIDLSGISVELPACRRLTWANCSDRWTYLSPRRVAQTAASLMEGYAEYVKEHPEGDMTGLAQSFQDYIRTDGQEILKTHIAEIIRTPEA